MSKTSLCLLLKKYWETGSVVDRPRPRVPKKLTNQHYVFIDQCLENDVHVRAIASTRYLRVVLALVDSQLFSRATRACLTGDMRVPFNLLVDGTLSNLLDVYTFLDPRFRQAEPSDSIIENIKGKMLLSVQASPLPTQECNSLASQHLLPFPQKEEELVKQDSRET